MTDDYPQWPSHGCYECSAADELLIPPEEDIHVANKFHGVDELSSVDALEPVGPVADGQKLLSRGYGTACLTLLVLSFLGFMPAEYLGFLTGRFFFDALHRMELRDTQLAKLQSPEDWHRFLIIHIVSANAWLLSACVQVFTGAFGGSWLRDYHRRLGSLTVFSALVFNVGAILLQLVKNASMLSNLVIIGNAALIMSNMAIGFGALRYKDVPLHKQAMTWTCAWSAAPGGTRLSRYFLSTFVHQYSSSSLTGQVAGSSLLILLAILPPTLINAPAAFATRSSRFLFVMNAVCCTVVGLEDLFSQSCCIVPDVSNGQLSTDI